MGIGSNANAMFTSRLCPHFSSELSTQSWKYFLFPFTPRFLCKLLFVVAPAQWSRSSNFLSHLTNWRTLINFAKLPWPITFYTHHWHKTWNETCTALNTFEMIAHAHCWMWLLSNRVKPILCIMCIITTKWRPTRFVTAMAVAAVQCNISQDYSNGPLSPSL